MTINEYQKKALKTESGMAKEYPRILNGLMGLNGEAGEAIDILKNGKKPSEIKYQRMSLNDIVVNGKTMAALGITLPEDIKSKAKIIN